MIIEYLKAWGREFRATQRGDKFRVERLCAISTTVPFSTCQTKLGGDRSRGSRYVKRQTAIQSYTQAIHNGTQRERETFKSKLKRESLA